MSHEIFEIHYVWNATKRYFLVWKRGKYEYVPIRNFVLIIQVSSKMQFWGNTLAHMALNKFHLHFLYTLNYSYYRWI